MKHAGKRLLSAALVLCLLLAALPITALAEETKPEWKSVGEGAAGTKNMPETALSEVTEQPENYAAPLERDKEERPAFAEAEEPSALTGTWVTVPGIVGGSDDYGNVLFDSSTGTIVKVDRRVTTANIPEKINGVSVTSIAEKAFVISGYNSLVESITIPNSVSSIGQGAFRGCIYLESIILPGYLKAIEAYTFYGCDRLKSILIPSSVTTIGEYAFNHCDALTSITIPDSVKTIGPYAFSHCDNMLNVTIGSSATAAIPTTIGKYAFSECKKLQNVFIGNAVKRIESGAFYYSSLTNVTIGNVVTTIGSAAFSSCSNLVNVTIPSSVKNIGQQAFAGCSKLRGAYFMGARPESGIPPYAGGMMFTWCAADFTVYYIEGQPGWGNSNYDWNEYTTAIWQPAAFTAPVLTLSRVAVNNVGMTWTASAGAAGYSISKGTSPNNLTWYASSTNPWFTDVGAAAGGTYYYQVKAYKGSGATATYSPLSNVITAVIPAAPALAAPRLTLARAAVNNVGLTWAAVSGATGYSVYRGTGGALTWYASTANPWFTDGRAPGGSTYYYQVMAYKGSGSGAVYSPPSNTVAAVIAPQTLPAPVVNLAYAQINHTGLTWNAISGATGYSIYRGTPGAALNWYASSTNPWFVDNATRPGTTYTYQVMAYRSGTPAVYGAKSAVKTATIPAIATPSVTVARPTAGNVGITWNGITGATGYSVYRGTASDNISWYAGTTNPWYSDRNTVAGVTYYYQVLTYLQTPEGNWYSAKSPVKIVTAR